MAAGTNDKVSWGHKVMRHALELLLAFLRRNDGASAAEYALIMAIVTTGIAGAAISLGEVIDTSFSNAASCLGDPNETNC